MKQLSLILTLFLYSQMAHAQNNSSYETLWKSVQKLESQALTQSALEAVKVISEKAIEEDNSNQIVKTLLYRSKYAMVLEEESQLGIINSFKSEIEKAASPTKNILESYLANLYWQYFQQNRYRFYNRTETQKKVDSTDFRTWDLSTLFKEIDTHFDASLLNKEALQNIDIKKFDYILNNQNNSEDYRPTLFDLLAHTALDFYKSSENNITRPANKFEIDNQQILCEAYEFTQIDLPSKDETSLQLKALETYQELLQFHFSDPELKALVYVDLERLRFIHQHAVFENKNDIYLEVLNNSAENLKQHELSGQYLYEIAQQYHNQGNTYAQTQNENSRWKQQEALAICDKVISKFPESSAAEKCKALKSEILAKSVQIVTEKFIPKNKPARLLVKYKNIEGLQLAAYKISQTEIKELNKLYEEKKQLAFIKNLEVQKKWKANLKNEDDHQQHGMEVLFPAMPNGQYLILATPNDDTSSFAFSSVQVTDFALIETKINNSSTRFQVINRNNGEPIKKAKLEVSYLENYNKPRKKETFVSDDMGAVYVNLTDENWSNVSIIVSHNSERALFGEYYIYKQQEPTENIDSYSCFLFTDRSIYRPGQPLYFKGIAIENREKGASVLSEASVTVDLIDVNGQTVSSSKFKTNEYGSFSGEFIIPNSGLTGNFSLEAHSDEILLNGHTSISVEEYKRPKFETSFEPITETYKVNDTVMVKGKANAYAGSKITDAKVTYRVKRSVYFPRWYYWSRPYSNISPQEITYGETLTDSNGEYEIKFEAIPDNSLLKENLPTFQYEVSADVTDINGETRSTSTIVTVGYHTLNATIQIPEYLDKENDNHHLTVSTQNLNGQSVPALGTIKIYKLIAPDYVLRPRPWSAPDYNNWKKEEFKTLFPHDAFTNEHNTKNWEKGKIVREAQFDTGQSEEIELKNFKKWDSGKYLIELETKDKFGQVVKDVAQTTVVSKKDKRLADNQLFQIKTDKETYTSGDKVDVTLASNAKDLNISVFIEKNGEIVDAYLISLSDNSKSFSVPVNEDDLGGFAINYSFSAFNSFESGSVSISVPYPSTDLEIETKTFRDKIRPGIDETWSFKIKGPQGEKVSAELLASMYDASLDAFRPHSWNFNPLGRSTYYSRNYSNANTSYGTSNFRAYIKNDLYSFTQQQYDSFQWFGFYFGQNISRFHTGSMMKRSAPMASAVMEMESSDASLDEVVTVGYGEQNESNNAPQQQLGQETKFEDVPIRKNLEETAFFLPQLNTDSEGNISFSFTSPEAMTEWKLQLLAHTKSLKSKITSLRTVTQKELMVIPNTPRFLREGDEITISSKIANLTNENLSGKARIELVDAVSSKEVTSKLIIPTSEEQIQSFKVDSLGNTQVVWRLKIPKGLQAVQYKIIAKAGDFSDGEQNLLPVLTNRMLVTETLPMWVKGNETKRFVLQKLKDNKSTSLQHHKLSLEITSNPAWYAVQALPYLMEYPHECNEQIFARYYANSLATHIANSNKRIQEVFNQWASSETLISNLEKNEELKSLLIQETPWLRDAQSETEQKKRIGLLFNLNKMKNEQAASLNKLKNNQKTSGAWAWFSGGPDNRTITQHIVSGIGHLKKLNVSSDIEEIRPMLEMAINYLDSAFVEEFQQMNKNANNINDDHLSQTQIHYLYIRSFFDEIPLSEKVLEIKNYYQKQAKKYWTKKSLSAKGMLALTLHRNNDSDTAKKILRSLKENSITSDELGMYWKENTTSWYWYQAPIETQALMIEAFEEIQNDVETVDQLKIWLLKNKQTNQWSTTKATTEAVYALLLKGSDWLSVNDAVNVSIGGQKISPEKLEAVQVEAGTGYFKTSWSGSEIASDMAEVQMSKTTDGIAWGALYWQYFVDLDKITSAETPLELRKNIFLKRNTDTGEKLFEIDSKTELKVGDLVRVRIELRADRDMEFVHMKDMRAAGFEPINVISAYKWQDGLGYYETTKDASTNFFFDYLPKGIFVFEYDVRVNNSGNFSNGITTIQSMYAPEFSSHSEGIRVSVKNVD
ncbi:uncharacterized protein YfaS (alpha-2-macroglobulin family) [Flavobacteriaceae bacterium MAR_2009_75]|nr:uncharacterized protein YfaS (alpha-2-macroglobulin family) [Flavobacteriaceae bacterium MAR_2009_75]